MRRRWSEPRDTRAAPYSPTQVATNTSPVCSETRRTPSRPRPCHPHKLDSSNATMAEKATAKMVTQVANKILDDFSEHSLWHRPGEWSGQVDHLIHNGELG